jgi:hypothetical protein
MNVVVVRQYRDGRRYPAEPLTREQRNRLRWLAHNLHCRDGQTIRQVQATMLESYAVRRSIGAIHGDLTRFECPHCAEPPPGPQPQSQEQPAAAVHQRPGGLTGMLSGG